MADRFARHWHDLARPDAGGVADAAIADWSLASEVAAHKSVFFAERSTEGEIVDYHAAVRGSLRLVPDGEAMTRLSADYQQMIEDGLLLDDAEPFDTLIERCAAIEKKANAKRMLE